jgi:heme/copper-type cytochrome/quinol oxidase subunit 3
MSYMIEDNKMCTILGYNVLYLFQVMIISELILFMCVLSMVLYCNVDPCDGNMLYGCDTVSIKPIGVGYVNTLLLINVGLYLSYIQLTYNYNMCLCLLYYKEG